MIKSTIFIVLILTICFLACKEKKTNSSKSSIIFSLDTSKVAKEISKVFQSDTAAIDNKLFVLSVYKNDSVSYFKVEKQQNTQFKTMLVDSGYGTNNSNLFFADKNNDGFLDIVLTKKWQDHSYLYNPKKENFIEVGEFHDIDTLKIAGQTIFFKDKNPILFLKNFEKDFQWMTELHSELFIINNDYQKISFATIDNFASLEDWNIEECSSLKSVVVNCYVPPYFSKYGETSIWNSGKSVDSIFMKANKFDSSFIVNYWTKNYKKLLPYGQVFKVRRAAQIITIKTKASTQLRLAGLEQ